jgi:hypothetical protein
MYTGRQGYRHVKGEETSKSKVKQTNGKGKSNEGKRSKDDGKGDKDDSKSNKGSKDCRTPQLPTTLFIKGLMTDD